MRKAEREYRVFYLLTYELPILTPKNISQRRQVPSKFHRDIQKTSLSLKNERNRLKAKDSTLIHFF